MPITIKLGFVLHQASQQGRSWAMSLGCPHDKALKLTVVLYGYWESCVHDCIKDVLLLASLHVSLCEPWYPSM